MASHVPTVACGDLEGSPPLREHVGSGGEATLGEKIQGRGERLKLADDPHLESGVTRKEGGHKEGAGKSVIS